jgi:hypothetical protein
MEISKGLKKVIVGALLFSVLGLAALGGISTHHNGTVGVGGVTAAYACCAPPPVYDDPPIEPNETPTPTPTPAP